MLSRVIKNPKDADLASLTWSISSESDYILISEESQYDKNVDSWELFSPQEDGHSIINNALFLPSKPG